jgi:hypothetical protein
MITRGIYRIRARHSGFYLDVAGALPVPGIPVIQWPSNGGANQLWEVVPLDRDLYHIVVQLPLKQMLAVPQASKEAGRTLIQWPNTNGDEQKWRFEDVGGGYFTIINTNSNLVVDVSGNFPWPGAPLCQWYRNGQNNQMFSFENV